MGNLSRGSFDGKLSLVAAMRAGYVLDLEADGYAWVRGPMRARCLNINRHRNGGLPWEKK